MSSPSQKRALQTYRRRLSDRGLARFEVLAPEQDRALLRAVAKRLADSDAAQVRAAIRRTVAGDAAPLGGVLAALRASPLVGAELDVSREETAGRDAGL